MLVTYRFPSQVDPDKQAKVIAIGQTAGTWQALAAEQDARIQEHLGQIERVWTEDDGSHRAVIRFPEINVDGDIGTLLTMIFGKYSMGGPAKVVDIELPDEYGLRPKFGWSGLQRHFAVNDRPLLMAICKPALGLTPDEHAAIHREVAFAGLDIIKDEELHGNLDRAPTLRRMEAIRLVIDEAKAETGKEMLYALNLTGRADDIIKLAHDAFNAGANAFLLNVLTHGFSVLEALAADPKLNVPVFAHPAFAGAMCLAPEYGLSYPVLLGKLFARAGADGVLYPSSLGNLPFEREDELAIFGALSERNVAPVPSAGVVPGKLPKFVKTFGTQMVLNAGTSIMDHPGGRAAGVQAFQEAWRRHQAGEPVDTHIDHEPLRQAIEKWGV